VRVHDAARRHGVADEDLLHAVRHAMRHIDLGDDMMMVLGPDRTGRMLEVGVLDNRRRGPGDHPRHGDAPEVRAVPAEAGVMTMPRSNAELDRLAREFEQRADQLDPDTVTVDDVSDLRAVAEAADAVAAAEARLREAVEVAHARGRSWGRIGVALGVTRQAARKRFGHAVDVGQ
jgi:hypothetical protein